MKFFCLNNSMVVLGLALGGLFGLPAEPAFAQHFYGNLTHYSPISKSVRPGRHYAIHKVYMHAGHGYDIELDSHDFDPYLVVLDYGHVVAQDDDGGPGLNSHIDFHPHHSCWYEILVTTFGHDETGHYHLDIHQH
jgi:hypothetical protein